MLRVDCRSFLCIDAEEVGIECLDVLLQRVGTVHVDASMAFSVGVEEAFRVEAAGIKLFQCVTLLNEQVPKLRGTARAARETTAAPNKCNGLWGDVVGRHVDHGGEVYGWLWSSSILSREC